MCYRCRSHLGLPQVVKHHACPASMEPAEKVRKWFQIFLIFIPIGNMILKGFVQPPTSINIPHSQRSDIVPIDH